MEAHDILLRPLLEGSKQFIIPVFQRDYSWTETQCDQLWRDVKRVGSNASLKVHFMGSVVYIAAEDSTADVPRWLLIDGQQRLTTITLMLIALRDRMRRDRQEDWPLPEQVEHQFLLNQYATGERRHKLQLRRRDNATLQWLIDRRNECDAAPERLSERILENYQDFKARLEEEDPKVIYEGLLKLKLVHVILTRGQDDPQMIFESLNSTGMDLTPGDLVRNYVLMRQEEAVQTELYHTRWLPIEQAFGSRYREKFDTFLNHYLVLRLRQNKPVKAADVYPQFKVYFTEAMGSRTVAEELEDMGRYAQYYVRYALGKESNADLKAAFTALARQVDVGAPPVMQLYAHHAAGKLDAKGFAEAVWLLESYVFRRSICGMQTRGLGSIMATLANRIKAEAPLLSLKVALKTRSANQRFPSDEEFRSALDTKDIYGLDNCKVLLDRLENHGTKERSSTATYTIEHIMPQNEDLVKEWQDMLGSEWKQVHQTYLHRLGNLTLTGYNPEYSDKSFTEKKTMKGGFNESPLRLNKYIREQESWTEAQMTERGQNLARMALKEWPTLKVDDRDVQQARLAELQERSSKYSESTLNLSEEAAALFQELREALLALGSDMVEVFHSKSVTYRTLEYVVEVLPRTRHLVLLYNLEFAELSAPIEGTEDMALRSFVVNAQETGGVLYRVHDIDQIATAVQIAQQVYLGLKG